MTHLRVHRSSSIQSELQNAMKKEGHIVFDQYLGILQWLLIWGNIEVLKL